MPTFLKDLVINDVSSVDRGAGEGVKVILFKRDFSSKERKHAADTGKAMPDGSFPIENEEDLHNAVRLAGNAKDPAKAKAHIKTRANAMGLQSALPDTWSKRDETVLDMRGLLKGDSIDGVNEAIGALNHSIQTINSDPDASEVDKSASVANSIEQFKSHLAGLQPTESTMTPEQIKKSIDDAVATVIAPMNTQIADLQLENQILKLSPEKQTFIKDFEKAAKKKFVDQNDNDQDDEMADAKKRAKSSIDPSIQKRLDEADRNAIILKGLVEEKEKENFAKRAVEAGMTAEQGEVLRKASKGNAEAFVEVEGFLKQAYQARDAALKAGGVFKEFGSKASGPSGATAMDTLIAKRDELRKTPDGMKLTQDQAFAKVFEDPANAELVKQEKAERNQRVGIVS